MKKLARMQNKDALYCINQLQNQMNPFD
jgi:hypothetical protein